MVSEKIKQIVGSYHKSNLINVLNEIQKHEGYISQENLDYLASQIRIAPAKIFSMASFYSFLKLEQKKGRHTIRVCNSPSCYMNGSENIINCIREITGLAPGEHNEQFHFEICSCIGCCDKPPAIMIDEKVYTKLDKEKIMEIIQNEYSDKN